MTVLGGLGLRIHPCLVGVLEKGVAIQLILLQPHLLERNLIGVVLEGYDICCLSIVKETTMFL